MRILISAAVAALACVAEAKVVLPDIFADHLVLQQNAEVCVWGSADPGEKVAVAFKGVTTSATADAKGDWEVRFTTGQADCKGAELVITGSAYSIDQSNNPNNQTILHDVLVGEVWLAAGQSNMEFKLKSDATAAEAIAASGDPLLRWFRPKRMYSREKLKDCKGAWTLSAPETSPDYSAIGYFFAKELRADLKVPVAVIDTSVGCTRAQAWMGMDVIRREPELYKDFIREYETKDCFSHCVQDPGRDPKTTGWEKPDLDVSGAEWRDIDAPGRVVGNRTTNYVQTIYGQRSHGVFWFRRVFDVPADAAGKDALLDIGADDYDITFFNGEEVGRTGSDTAFPYQQRRNYPVPGRLVRAGRNVVAVRVHGEQHADGLWGKLALRCADGKEIDLANGWKIRDEFVREGSKAVSAEKVEHMPAYFYNAMLGPIERFRCKGAIWYQGCCNARKTGAAKGGYPCDLNIRILSDMIGAWRAARRDPSFPVFMVQLAGYGQDWAEYRECQRVAGETIPHCGTVTALDVGDKKNIHPKQKTPVAHRLALRARHDVYGETGFAWRSPEIDKAVFDGDSAVLSFRYAESLKTSDGKAPATFRLADESGAYRQAVATIDGAKITVRPAVPKTFKGEAKGVSYGWGACPPVNVESEAGLPLFPFQEKKP